MIFRKFIIQWMSLLTISLVIYSCNGDVFVPDTRPSVTSVRLSGDGDSIIIAYQPEGLQRIRLQHLFSFPLQVYDKNGQLISGEMKPGDMSRVVLKSQNIDMEFISVPGGIKVKVIENMYVGGVEMFLELDYGYTSHMIEIGVGQCSPYDIIDVKYDMDSIDVFGPWAEGYSASFVVNNPSDQEMRVTDTPLENARATFRFDIEASVRLLTSIGEKPMPIPIPSFKNKEAGIYGRTVNYGFDVAGNIDFEPTIDKSTKVALLVPPNAHRRYFLYIEHMELSVPVRFVIRHPVNGHVRDITGKLRVEEPTGFFYGYQNVNDNE